jgi:hypothetical protein
MWVNTEWSQGSISRHGDRDWSLLRDTRRMAVVYRGVEEEA